MQSKIPNQSSITLTYTASIVIQIINPNGMIDYFSNSDSINCPITSCQLDAIYNGISILDATSGII